MLLRRSALLSIILFFVLAIVSLLFYFLRPAILERRAVFFPEINSGNPTIELRFLPREGQEQVLIRELIRAIIAGPQDVTMGHIFPKDTQIKQVFTQNSTIYIVFNKQALAPDALCPLEGRARFIWLSWAIKYNFPFMGPIQCLVEDKNLGYF